VFRFILYALNQVGIKGCENRNKQTYILFKASKIDCERERLMFFFIVNKRIIPKPILHCAYLTVQFVKIFFNFTCSGEKDIFFQGWQKGLLTDFKYSWAVPVSFKAIERPILTESRYQSGQVLLPGNLSGSPVRSKVRFEEHQPCCFAPNLLAATQWWSAP